MEITSITVANEIMRFAKKERLCQFTPMHLNKLTYILYGFCLIKLKRKMFWDRIEAWKYGPMIVDLYHATKHFGRDTIPLDFIRDEPSGLEDDEQSLLEDVVRKLAHHGPIRLANAISKDDSAWAKILEDGEWLIPNKTRPLIRDDLILDEFKGFMVNQEAK